MDTDKLTGKMYFNIKTVIRCIDQSRANNEVVNSLFKARK